MEFDFNVSKLFKSEAENIIIIEPNPKIFSKSELAKISLVLDAIGESSSKAQGLRSVITSSNKFFCSDHKIFLKVNNERVIGLLKIGKKKLFIRDEIGDIKEITPMCVLDFYVYETEQRSGQGKKLFEFMLEYEGYTPDKIAYDRPSKKLLNFLKKYYNLIDYVPQNNNFVVYNRYFESNGSAYKYTNKTLINRKNEFISNSNQNQLKKTDFSNLYMNDYYDNCNSNKAAKKENTIEDVFNNKYNLNYNTLENNTQITKKSNNYNNIYNLTNINLLRAKQVYSTNSLRPTQNSSVPPWAINDTISSSNTTTSSSYGAYYKK